MSSSVVTILATATVLNWITFEALWSKAKKRAGKIIYPLARSFRCLLLLGIPTLTYGAVDSYVRQPKDWWLSALLLTIALFAAFVFPATIVVSQEKIVSRKWFGIRQVQINWGEIEAIYP